MDHSCTKALCTHSTYSSFQLEDFRSAECTTVDGVSGSIMNLKLAHIETDGCRIKGTPHA